MMYAYELINESLEVKKPVINKWNPITKIGLKHLGGKEIEKNVISGYREGRRWTVIFK